ncbi:MAG: antibiotic biosynthesis monooxygenase [Frankia sp.]|nr:antibiotic biosynthesis monooxygenase [Frankia sp.]
MPAEAVVVVAQVTPIPERRAELVEVLERAIAATHDEPGCELYALHEDDQQLVMIEKWSSRAALEAHLTGAQFKEMAAALAPLCAVPATVRILTPHPAGAAAQGAL